MVFWLLLSILLASATIAAAQYYQDRDKNSLLTWLIVSFEKNV